jgi:hypothetical protein
VGSVGYDPYYPQWNNKPSTEGYQPLGYNQPSQVGDRVIYYGPGIYGNNTAIHSGIVSGVDSNGRVTQITSKWGEGAIYTHHPAQVPNEYEQNRTYYRKDNKLIKYIITTIL